MTFEIRGVRLPRRAAAAAACAARLCLAGPTPDGWAPTVENPAKPPGPAPAGMVWIPGGEFTMGCADPRDRPCGGREPMEDARPLHRVSVDGFWMDATEVTNDAFARFVRATGYVTVAERKPRAEDFPGVPEDKLVPGSAVFDPPAAAVPLTDYLRWWRYVPGANWRHPSGPADGIEGRGGHPVVQVAYEDAAAYAAWARKRLPTEAEWEFAARGGKPGQAYPWGDDLQPEGKWAGNLYQGPFPTHDTGADGFAGLAPVGRFPANAYGLFDMAGNAWEWCSDWYRPDYFQALADATAASGRPARNPKGPESGFDPAEPGSAKRVHRGGSFLCSDRYCARYVTGSRGKGEVSSAANHLGFRCVRAPSETP